MTDLDKCPGCGGPADNGHDRCYPPNPYFCTKCMALTNDARDNELTNMLMDCAERFGNYAKSAQADKRAWEHLLVYAPLDVRFRTNNPNRNPYADMAHEHIETGRAVQRTSNLESDKWIDDPFPCWHPKVKYRWADEQPKPDVVEYIVTDKRFGGAPFIRSEKFVNAAASDLPIEQIKVTRDAEGNLKDVEKI